MTIKKAIIIGTLCAIGATLTTYAIKKGIDIKPKTITAVNADSLYTQKNRITTEALTDGWQYDVEPGYTDAGQTTYWTNPETITQTKPTDLTNTTWTLKTQITFPNSNTQYIINFSDSNRQYNKIAINGAYQTKTINYYASMTYNAYEDSNFHTGWYLQSFRTITITGGTDVTNQNLIDFLWNNQEDNPTFLAGKRYENYTSTYLGIEYVMMSQKIFSEDKIKSEGLFFIKLQSTGITRQLILERAVLYTTIPNMVFNDTYATYNAQFKMSKMTTMNITESSTLYQQKGSFLNKYNSIQNKTNIYSVDAYVSGTTMNQQQNITYSNETGPTGTATFGHATSASSSNATWTISQDTDIYTQNRGNYVVIYFNCEVTNFGGTIDQEQHSGWYQTAYERIASVTKFAGFGVSSNPIAPPDIEDGNFMSLSGMILNILTLPFTFLSQAFDLTLWANTPWAFNIKNAIFVMIGILTFLFIIRLFTRGFDSLGNFTDEWQRHKLTKEQRKMTKVNRQKAEKSINKDKK